MRPLLALAFCLVMGSPAVAEEGSISGIARVIDGDTIAIGDERVRLAGIDACELDQVAARNAEPWYCGQAAAGWLVAQTTGKKVLCEWQQRDRYNRPLAFCAVGDLPLDLGLLVAGLAIVYRHSGGEPDEHQVEMENSAKERKAGLWGSVFIDPKEWRAGGKLPATAAARKWHLYRTSIFNDKHYIVATFDLNERLPDGGDFNKESCEHTRDLYSAQPETKNKFWCEKAN